MIQSLYSGATGMEAQQLNLNTIANNLANANTTGFKRSKIEFQDLLYQKPRAVGAEAGGGNVVPTGTEVGSGSRVVSTAKVFTQGQVKQTGERFGFVRATSSLHRDGIGQDAFHVRPRQFFNAQ